MEEKKELLKAMERDFKDKGLVFEHSVKDSLACVNSSDEIREITENFKNENKNRERISNNQL